ncbi:MAG: cytidine deaminase [Candidatus Eremiobacteraeota bacterium]|nr:cytidine deaminase [Candidatus Eremiobacteraeota bacterium]MBC5826833.1 cytidine deaminase [Candidatus Eremiobacteraeota bacterium]
MAIFASDPTTDRDRDLIQAARKILEERYKPGWHQVGAALRTPAGKVFAAVHLEANVGRAAVCAEAIALGMAAAAGEAAIETIVAVVHDGSVVSPCGICREVITDYSPQARVIVPDGSAATVAHIEDLLPRKYTS